MFLPGKAGSPRGKKSRTAEPRGSSPTWLASQSQKTELSSQPSPKGEAKLCLSCSEHARSSADGSRWRLPEELLYFLPCPQSSVCFETVTKSLLPSRQRRCSVSTKHPPPLPLSSHFSLPVCNGWEESNFLSLNRPPLISLQLFLDKPQIAYLSQPHALLLSILWLPILVMRATPGHDALPQLLDISRVWGLAEAPWCAARSFLFLIAFHTLGNKGSGEQLWPLVLAMLNLWMFYQEVSVPKKNLEETANEPAELLLGF